MSFGDVARNIGKKSAEAAGQPLEAIAKEVIAGKWGAGEERTKKLTEAGYDAAAVQKLVNELMKK